IGVHAPSHAVVAGLTLWGCEEAVDTPAAVAPASKAARSGLGEGPANLARPVSERDTDPDVTARRAGQLGIERSVERCSRIDLAALHLDRSAAALLDDGPDEDPHRERRGERRPLRKGRDSPCPLRSLEVDDMPRRPGSGDELLWHLCSCDRIESGAQ